MGGRSRRARPAAGSAASAAPEEAPGAAGAAGLRRWLRGEGQRCGGRNGSAAGGQLRATKLGSGRGERRAPRIPREGRGGGAGLGERAPGTRRRLRAGGGGAAGESLPGSGDAAPGTGARYVPLPAWVILADGICEAPRLPAGSCCPPQSARPRGEGSARRPWLPRGLGMRPGSGGAGACGCGRLSVCTGFGLFHP